MDQALNKQDPKSTFAIRSLKQELTAEQAAALKVFVQDTLHRPYELNPLELIRAAFVGPAGNKSTATATILTEAVSSGTSDTRMKEILIAAIKEPGTVLGQLLSMTLAVALKGILGNKDSNDSLFCSELVAGAYKAIGYIPEVVATNGYAPKDFAATGASAEARAPELQREDILGPEVPLTDVDAVVAPAAAPEVADKDDKKKGCKCCIIM
jgi:hypothetical protein